MSHSDIRVVPGPANYYSHPGSLARLQDFYSEEQLSRAVWVYGERAIAGAQAFLPAAFGDAGRSTRNIVGMFWRKKPASRIVPAEIDSVGSAGSCTRRNPTLFSRNARRRFE